MTNSQNANQSDLRKHKLIKKLQIQKMTQIFFTNHLQHCVDHHANQSDPKKHKLIKKPHTQKITQTFFTHYFVTLCGSSWHNSRDIAKNIKCTQKMK